MSVVTWVTPKGSLGTIPESQFYSYNLQAIDSDEQPLFYSFISGELPGGMYVTQTGELRGVPTITQIVLQTRVYAFTVRATNPNGVIADRSFSLTVSNIFGPEIFPKPDLIGAWFDGTYLEYRFNSINDNPAAIETWSVLGGTLPPGVTLDSDGTLSGYIDLVAANSDLIGFEAAPVDLVGIDAIPRSTDRYYNFTVQVTDGAKYNSVNVRVLIVSKGNYTGDNDITLINNTFIKIDADNNYRPILLNVPATITNLVSGDTFAYKLIAYDPEGEDVSWRVDEFQFSGLDELDAAPAEFITGNVSLGPYILTEEPTHGPLTSSSVSVRVNGIAAPIPNVDYTISGNALTFSSYNISYIVRESKISTVQIASHTYQVGDTIIIRGAADSSFNGTFMITAVGSINISYFQNEPDVPFGPSSGTVSKFFPLTTDTIEVLYIKLGNEPGGKGFDTLLFDQGIEGLPLGFPPVNADTGWIHGTLPAQIPDLQTYNINIRAYRTNFPSLESTLGVLTLSVKRTLNELIEWTTPTDLGTIDNGAISELYVEAVNNLGKDLEYSIIYDNYRRVPQGLKMLRTGRLIGRTTFRYFSLDNEFAYINLASTDGIEVGMSIQGVGIASGSSVTEIVDDNVIIVKPAIYVIQGTALTFSNETVTKVAIATTNAISTVIDSGNTTFDQKSTFTVKATAIDGSISSTKNFTVTIKPRNLAPYENLYLKALLPEEQRTTLDNIIKDEALFPVSMIYRPDDPYFGLAKSLKILFLPGLSPRKIEEYVLAIANNHYTKTINFGDIKTARAVDSNGNIIYEVVYVDAVDPLQFDTSGPPLQKTLSIANGYLYNNQEYKTIYPNSFNNMQYRIDNNIGYTNRGALPTWMTSVQENGLVLGLTRAIVLAYVKPGSAKLIQYRLQSSLKLPAGNFSFVADRYQWENYLSKFYNSVTGSFLPSKDTTFDRYPNAVGGIDLISTQVVEPATESFTIQIEQNQKVGIGWIVTGISNDCIIPANGVSIVEVNGNTLTLESPVTVVQGTFVRINGISAADYAVSVPFNRLNGSTQTNAINFNLIDGIADFKNGETVIFAKQEGFPNTSTDNGWIDSNGNYIPGYLDKLSGASSANQQGGIWQLNFFNVPEVGFDEVGFDEPGEGTLNGYFDQGGETEIQLEFVKELILNQTIKISRGKTYPATTMQYRLRSAQSIPDYSIFSGALGSNETTFDGGRCQCRESDLRGVSGRRGGTAFSNNRDKYEVPESLDKYIKFPQTGVFV
jgi:hypothetical protein